VKNKTATAETKKYKLLTKETDKLTNKKEYVLKKTTSYHLGISLATMSRAVLQPFEEY